MITGQIMRIKGLESLTFTGHEKQKKSINKLYEKFENRETVPQREFIKE